MTPSEIGAVAAEAREEAGLTQKEMAKRLNVHQSQISRLESEDGNAENKGFRQILPRSWLRKGIKIGRYIEDTLEASPPPHSEPA